MILSDPRLDAIAQCFRKLPHLLASVSEMVSPLVVVMLRFFRMRIPRHADQRSELMSITIPK